MASVGQVAAGIAHEVRNPLTAVKGFLQLLREKHEERYVEIAQSELDNALHTLENLLQVSKPDLEDEPSQPTNLAVELEAVLQLFQDQIYRVQVITRFEKTDASVYGKRNQLKKAFFNLLKNAYEAIEDKGVISVSHTVMNGYVMVTIEDSGAGIPKDKIVLLSTPFFTTKSQGTGMGLTQVFSVVYEHGGHIKVESEEGLGTTFTISIPLDQGRQKYEVNKLHMEFQEGQELRDFFEKNKKMFEEKLLQEAVNVKDKVEEIQTIGNINLLHNAHKLVLFLIEGRKHDIIVFAKEEGKIWAKHALTLSFKLEWIHALRRVVWGFLYNYDRLKDSVLVREHFYTQEKQINELLDQFLNYFFISYSQYKDELLRSHREMVEDLSVPIIPLSESMCILPLIGTIDTYRANTIVDKVINQIGVSRMQRLIIDLSGVAYMDTAVISHLLKVIDGSSIMGCHVVITGVRPEIVKTMLKLGVSFEQKAETKGTLQQALSEYLRM
nr:ATP-binding protein [Paenibacillus turpanensis]